MTLLKKIVFFHLVPIVLALLISAFLIGKKPLTMPELSVVPQAVKSIRYIKHFDPYQLNDQVAFSSALYRSVPVLIGSSELTSNHLKGLAQNFFNPEVTKETQLLSFGHAGFQSFGILTALAANRELLKNAKLTIILSPGWFEQQYCKGTSLHSFFEFAPPNYIYKILKDDSLDPATRNHIASYIRRNYDKISRPDEGLRLLEKEENSKIMRIANKPFASFNSLELKEREETDLYLRSQELIVKTLLDKPASKHKFKAAHQNWDSLMQSSKEEFVKISSNNNVAVENSYYDTWLKNKPKKKLVAVDKETNQEYKDLEVLLSFLRTSGAEVSFVIMPLNPKAHEDLTVLNPIINDVRSLLQKEQFKYLDMFVSNASEYVDGTLEDIMHPYNLGWYQIDKFIVEQYAHGN
ncbi:MAG: hypothetical protein JNL60_06345 [Bacteroidia bacterium]|nr:hypothetical protein [Bacteroidia bacterium]